MRFPFSTFMAKDRRAPGRGTQALSTRSGSVGDKQSRGEGYLAGNCRAEPTLHIRTVHERLASWAVMVAGAVVLVTSFARFVIEGGGTPAPIAPTTRLVVGGWYRYVR